MTESVREHLERILASYEQIGTRFASMGGVTKVLGLLEDVRREHEHVSEHDLERVTGDIKQVVESLLKVDYELRKIQNLKLLFAVQRQGWINRRCVADHLAVMRGPDPPRSRRTRSGRGWRRTRPVAP